MTAERSGARTVDVGPVPAAVTDIVVFLPPAGAVESPYTEVGDHLPAGTAAAHCEMPGRGRLAGHPTPVSVPEAVTYWQEELAEPAASRRLHLFGHSLGALLAYELAGRVPVTSLMISGARDPGSPARTLIGAAFAAVQAGRPGTGTDWLDADLRMRRSYRLPDRAPRTPFAVFTGRTDAFVRPDEITGWTRWIDGPLLGRHVFDGGHDYYRHAPAAVAQAIGQVVRLAGQHTTPSSAEIPQARTNGVRK